jgi:ATP-dependent DNA ligase
VDQILQISPATCDGKAPSENFVAEEKLDGHRALLHFEYSLKRAYLTSRRISKKTGLYAENGLCVPHITEPLHHLATLNQLGYTVLDGEILVPNGSFEDVQSVLGSLPEKAVAWQLENTQAVYAVYDCLFYNGDDLRDLLWVSRHSIKMKLMEVMCRYLMNRGFIFPLQSSHFNNKEEAKVMFDRVISRGGEGLILKDKFARYGRGWSKWKYETTYDVVVTGYESGQGKFSELIGALRFGAWDSEGNLVPIGKCSGMPDGNVTWSGGAPNRKGSVIIPDGSEQPVGSRAWFSERKYELEGMVIEVKCNGLTKHGNLRHPQFVRLREDKDAKQCLLPVLQKTTEI